MRLEWEWDILKLNRGVPVMWHTVIITSIFHIYLLKDHRTIYAYNNNYYNGAVLGAYIAFFQSIRHISVVSTP
jgi:hypothetical protein